jgi:site-specific recombinase XerD
MGGDIMSAVDDFKRYLEVERRASAHTVEGYMTDLVQFFDIVKKDIDKVESDDITLFLEKLVEKGLIVSTTNRKLSSVKTFYKYLVLHKVLKYDPSSLIQSGKLEQRLPKPVDLEDINLIINIVDNLRDKLMFELLIGLGVRREELAGIRKSNINYRRGYVRVFGKGNKERIVPAYKKALDLALEYGSSHNSPWLFSGRDPSNHISVRRVNELVSYWVDKAGLSGKGITPHKFRHSFGTYLYENGADIRAIQDMMGHASIDTTNRYTKVSLKRNIEEYKKYHPMAK